MTFMKQNKLRSRFEKKETGYHRHAKMELTEWVNGEMEKEFKVDGKTVFIPDVICVKNGIIDCVYEVLYSHPINGYKLGMIQYWCYMNGVELTVYEVSAEYILKQTAKPDRIETIECYTINPFETFYK